MFFFFFFFFLFFLFLEISMPGTGSQSGRNANTNRDSRLISITCLALIWAHKGPVYDINIFFLSSYRTCYAFLFAIIIPRNFAFYFFLE